VIGRRDVLRDLAVILAAGALIWGCNDSAPKILRVGTGSQARDYLQSAPYDTLVVEVDYVVGSAPDAAALSLLETRLLERCDKPGGVQVMLDTEIAAAGAAWDVAALEAAATQHRARTSAGTTAALYVLYVDGAWGADTASEKVLGVSFSPTAVAVFRETIRQVAARSTVQAVEQAVLVHEVGHCLGLVNNGVALTSSHQDVLAGPHCTNARCVMNASIETQRVDLIFGGIPNQFGAECIADLQAAGGL